MSRAGGRPKPDYLKVVDGDARDQPSDYDDGKCGAPTEQGHPCRRDAGEDGTCWQHDASDLDGRTSYPPPDHLGEHGANLWSSLVDEAVRLGMLTQLDWPVFTALCEVWQARREAWDDMQERGRTIPGGNRGEKKNPSVSQFNNMTKEMRQLLGELGFTPSARAKIDLEKAEEGKEGIADYL